MVNPLARGCAVVRHVRARQPGAVLLTPTGPPIEETDEALILDRKPRAGFRILHFYIALTMIAAEIWVISHPSPQTGLLGFFLLLVGSPSALAFLQYIRGRERLRIEALALEYLWFDGLIRRRRSIPLGEIMGISTYTKGVLTGDGGISQEYGVEIKSVGQPLRLGQTRDSSEAVDLLRNILARLCKLHPGWINRVEEDEREIVDRSRMLIEPPSDCAIICRREWDHTEFIGRNCRRWNVRPGELTSSVRLFGIGWSRTVDVEWLDRLELRRSEEKISPFRRRFGFNEPRPGFELALVDLKENDVALIRPLTRGEALWMAGILADVLKDAFLKDGQTYLRWSVSADAPAFGSKVMGDRWLDEATFS